MSVRILHPKKMTKNKLERPKPWHVVLYNNSGELSACQTCLLRDVFRMSTDVAGRHTSEAFIRGRSSVLTSSKDVVESKAEQANDARSNGKVCFSLERKIFFKAEPA